MPENSRKERSKRTIGEEGSSTQKGNHRVESSMPTTITMHHQWSICVCKTTRKENESTLVFECQDDQVSLFILQIVIFTLFDE